MSKYTVNVEYTIDVHDDEFDENDDPIGNRRRLQLLH